MLHAFLNPPASTCRLISELCDPFAPLWPGSTTITRPANEPAALDVDVAGTAVVAAAVVLVARTVVVVVVEVATVVVVEAATFVVVVGLEVVVASPASVEASDPHALSTATAARTRTVRFNGSPPTLAPSRNPLNPLPV